MDKNGQLQRCIKILKAGGLIVAPSDTVYGLVCDATNENAVKKLIAVKNRPWGKPISVFSDGFTMMETLVEVKAHTKVIEQLLPGPFTIILPSKHVVCSLLESERKTLGVRYTTHPFIQELVRVYGKPLTATSANISGRPPHYEASGFIKELPMQKKHLIDHVVDMGKLPHNKPSTIVDLTGSSLQLLRRGDVIPVSKERFNTSSASETKKVAGYLIEKYAQSVSDKPLTFILEGEMGVGKTVFAQGLGTFLGVPHVVSPTYVIYYEYQATKDPINMFLHADLFNIEEVGEFSHLGLTEYLKPHTVLCLEWGERLGPLFEKIKEKSTVIVVEMGYVNEKERAITIKEL